MIYLEKRLNSDTRVVGTFNFVCQDPIFGNKRIRKHFDKQIHVASKYIYKQDEKNQFIICYRHILDLKKIESKKGNFCILMSFWGENVHYN